MLIADCGQLLLLGNAIKRNTSDNNYSSSSNNYSSSSNNYPGSNTNNPAATTLPTFYDITVIQTSQRATAPAERDGNRPLERDGIQLV